MTSFDPTAIELDATDHTNPFQRRMRGQVTHTYEYFDVPFITDLGGGLYQGGVQTGLVLPSEIKNLVSLYVWEQYTALHDVDSALFVTMHDSKNQGLEQVEELAQWVANLLKREQTVLVHCQAGLNRSSLVVARALILSGRVDTGQEAIDFIREKRSPQCFANPSFRDYVMRSTT